MLYINDGSGSVNRGKIAVVMGCDEGCGLMFIMSTGRRIVPSTFSWDTGWWTVKHSR